MQRLEMCVDGSRSSLVELFCIVACVCIMRLFEVRVKSVMTALSLQSQYISLSPHSPHQLRYELLLASLPHHPHYSSIY